MYSSLCWCVEGKPTVNPSTSVSVGSSPTTPIYGALPLKNPRQRIDDPLDSHFLCSVDFSLALVLTGFSCYPNFTNAEMKMHEFDENAVYSEMYLHLIWSTKDQDLSWDQS